MKRNRPTFRAATAFGLLFVFFAIATARLAAQETPPTFVERIQKTAETLEIFPVDLIARDGPLSFFEKNSGVPKISVRKELSPESFARFYDFCQLAFDATPRDVDALAAYLPQASPREAALISTVFYVYAYPWEARTPVDRGDKLDEAIKTRSWLALQYPFGVFDGATREKFRPQSVDSQRLRRLVARLAQSDEIAFPAVADDPKSGPTNYDDANRETLAFVKSLFPGPNVWLEPLLERKNVVDEIRRKYPDSAPKRISFVLYDSLGSDMFDFMSDAEPREGNASATPKTLGQIARQLIASWEPTHLDAFQKTAETLDVFPVDLIARNGEISRFRPGSPLPDVESDAESFERFREFCQLALDATPQDVDALVERLAPGNFPENAPKETALILTVLYVYAFPWEKVAPIESENERAEAAKTQSWFALQFASGAFDLSVRRNFRPQNAESLNRLARIVAQFAAYPQAAFPARPLDENADPVAEDADETSRTLGQIARLLVDSWEPTTPFSRLERIQLAAETLEFFPVDLIARDGPLSFFEKNSPYPKISFRKELTPVAFERFYNFCQLALDATPQDVDALIEYLPQPRRPKRR